MAQIAVATFQHETNTFAPSKAGFADFESGGGWPGARKAVDEWFAATPRKARLYPLRTGPAVIRLAG